MKIIAIRKNPNVYLPEINAYKEYFTEFRFLEYYDEKEIENESIDLIWKFMGIDTQRRNVPTIHEYVSLSVGHFASLKDNIKKLINSQPNFRIFLNQEIRDHYSFHDGISYCYRDMGIDDNFFIKSINRKEYDFVYIGSMEQNRNIKKMLNFFKRKQHMTILMIGQPPNELFNNYKMYKNIIFTGRVKYSDVPAIATKAEYAMNYMPDVYPFNIQTSTKLLEYAAMGLKIVTTEYYWANKFETERNAKFFHINEDCSNLSLEQLRDFDFGSCNVQDLRWKNILEHSGIKKHLINLL